jgi:hypothetical protein
MIAMMTARISGIRIWLMLCMSAASICAQTQAPRAGHIVGVRTRLEKSLDANKVKVGDAVVAKPEAKIHLADGMDLATNSLMVGHVDTVQPSVAKGNSAISVTFDKVQLKSGKEIPIKATILWIGQPPNLLDPATVSAAADRSTPGVGADAGSVSVTGQMVPVTQGNQGSEITGAPVHYDNGSASEGGGRLPEGVSWQMNAIPRVNFFSDAGRNDSGWFRSKGMSVFVPSGTVLAFAILMPAAP